MMEFDTEELILVVFVILRTNWSKELSGKDEQAGAELG